MQEVVRQLSERLAKLGHSVTVATSKSPQRRCQELNGVRIAEFDISGNEVRGYLGDTESYRRFLLAGEFDVVTNFAAQQWATDLAFPLLDSIGAKKVFVPTGFSGLFWPEYQGYFTKMPDWMKRYDMNVFLSDDYRDINFAREHGVERTMLIPNGAGADEFLSLSGVDVRALCAIPSDHFLVILVGSHTGVKGHAEAMRIFSRARLDRATLLIIANDLGGGCTKLCRLRERWFNKWYRFAGKRKRILVRSLSREETVAAYRQADLFLFPSNIECSPIVLFECMASRTPFLSTDVGNAAEIARWSGAGQILPTQKTRKGFSKAKIAASARMLEVMAGDASLRTTLAEAGHRAWLERFTWERIADRYERLYLELAGGNAPLSSER